MYFIKIINIFSGVPKSKLREIKILMGINQNMGENDLKGVEISKYYPLEIYLYSLVYSPYLLIMNKLSKHINIEINTIQFQPSTDQQLKEIANTQVTSLFLDNSSLEKHNLGKLMQQL